MITKPFGQLLDFDHDESVSLPVDGHRPNDNTNAQPLPRCLDLSMQLGERVAGGAN